MLNPYNRWITLSWLANTNIQPCTGAKAVIEYVGKYAVKPEKGSSSYKELEEIKTTFGEVYSNCSVFHNHEETFDLADASRNNNNAHVQAQDIKASFAKLAARLPDASSVEALYLEDLVYREMERKKSLSSN
jgi:hypothetical protein